MVRMRVRQDDHVDAVWRKARRSEALEQLSRVGSQRARAGVDENPPGSGIDQNRDVRRGQLVAGGGPRAEGQSMRGR